MVDGKNETALGLGERLRSARKARALTLEQAAFTLRLEVPVLRALEDEDYAALGAAVFVRGHLKAYARLLGLSEEAVLAAYRAADPGADAPPKVTRELEKPLTATPGPLALAAAVGLALLAILLMFVFSAGDPPRRPVPEPLPMAPASPEPEPAPLPLPPPEPELAPAPALAPAVDVVPGVPPVELAPLVPPPPTAAPLATPTAEFE